MSDKTDALLDISVKRARACLDQDGEFYPFAIYIGQDDKIALLAPALTTDRPDVGMLLELLRTGLKRGAAKGMYKATALVYDVSIGDPKGGPERVDCVKITLEDASAAGEAEDVYLPYQKIEGGGMAYGDLFTSTGKPRVFKKPDAKK
jgi:hypothetical protein